MPNLEPRTQAAALMDSEEDQELQHIIAVELDKPSLYMGGPSIRSLVKAQDVIEQLRYRGYTMEHHNA